MTRSSLRLAAPVLAPVCASVLALSACGGGTSTTAGTSTTSAAVTITVSTTVKATARRNRASPRAVV